MYRLAALALAACAFAVEVPGKCPQVKTADNFDYDAFRTGTWYEVGRTDHIAESGGQCSYTEYTPSGDGFYIKSYHVASGELKQIEGYARRAPESGKMIHSLPYGPNGEITDSILNVLATDNKNFALLYYCNYNAEKNTHRDLVWIFSRNREIEPKATDLIEAAYDAHPFLDKNALIKVEFAPALCEISASSVEVPGFCPEVKTVQNFDVKKFGNGIWYEIARTPHITEKDGQCSHAEYIPYGEGFQVKNYHVDGGELKFIEGYAEGSEPGKMVHSLPYGANGAITHSTLNVLATDNNYAILYHCNYNAQKKSHRNLLWIFSRSKVISDEGIAAVEAVYKNNKFLRQEELIQIDFSEKACQISASSVEVPGFCPDAKLTDNFDFKSFGSGIWYELARTPHLAEKDGQCSYTEYTPSAEGFDIKSYHTEKGELKKIEGYATPAGDSKMYHSLPYGRNGEITHSLLNVLATDNKNYAIVYYCNYNPEKKSHRNLVWVLSRSNAPKPQERDAIEVAFNNAYKANPFLRREELITVDLSSEACRYTTKNVKGQGFCPKVKTVQNFDIKSFGKRVWYEVARTNHISEQGGQCSYAQYTPNGERFDIKNYHVEDGELKLIEGYAKAAAEAGKMIHSLPYGANGEITDNVLNVLATDNNNYAVLYYCNFNAKDYSHRNLVWVFSRSKGLSAEANAALEAVFKANDFLDKGDLIKVDFSKKACQISAASVEVPGFCPFVKTDEGFDVKSFGNGVWYEVKRTPHSAEKGGQCSRTKYTPASDGFHVSSYHVNDGELKFIEGYAKAHYEPGKMVHSLPYGANGAITHSTLNVLATDNDNYAVLYHCNYNTQKKSHRNLVWVFSRSQKLSAEGSAAVEATFNSYPNLRKEELIDVQFGDACQITADSVEVPGVCPQNVETVKDFDVKSFGQGVWYELARTPHISEKGGHCSYAKYTPAADGFHLVNYHVEGGELRLIEGYAKAANAAGKMIHSLPYGANGEITDSVLNVLATNNKNYAVLYHCNYNAQKNSHRNLVWVFSRSKKMSEETKAALDSVFNSNKYLNKDELIKVDLSEDACRIDASSVANSGFCPHVKTAENFDIEKFNNGVWYELARTPHIAEKGGQCSYAQYTPSGDGFIVKNYHIADGELKKFEGFAKAASEAGKMIHSLAYGENGAITDSTLNVLATDNNNYVILYYCNFNAQKKSHRNLVWVFSRSKELSAEGQAALDAVYNANPFLRKEELITVDFSEKACQIKLPGRCPQVKTAQNFDLKTFGSGVWYELMRTPHIAEEGGKCSFTSYTPSDNGFDVRSYHVNVGQLRAIQGHATLAPGRGQMIHSLPYGENGTITDSVLNVLATDNDNYAVLYHCNYDQHSGSHRNLFWVVSRKTELSSEANAAVKKVLKDYPQIAKEALINVEFSKEACEYEAASIEIPGSCPQVTTANNFDIKSFGNGVWYEVLKYKNVAEKGGKCGYAKHTPTAEGFIVDNYHTNSGVLKKISGSAKLAGPGKMIHSLPYGPKGSISDNLLNVLATDNKSYAVLYHCNYNAEKNSHRNFAWVFSRSQDLSTEAKNDILASIKLNPFIIRNLMTENDFSKEACAAA